MTSALSQVHSDQHVEIHFLAEWAHEDYCNRKSACPISLTLCCTELSLHEYIYLWLRARLQWLQCVSNGVTAVLHLTINMYYILHHTDIQWCGTGIWYASLRKTMAYLSYIINTMAADDLVTYIRSPAAHQQPWYWPSPPGINHQLTNFFEINKFLFHIFRKINLAKLESGSHSLN